MPRLPPASGCCFSLASDGFLCFVQSLQVELILSFENRFRRHLLQVFSSQFYPTSPDGHRCHLRITPFGPAPLTTPLPPRSITTSLYLPLLGCPEDFVLVNTMSPAPKGLPGPR